MTKIITVISCVILIISLAGCAFIPKGLKPSSAQKKALEAMSLAVYSGPKAKIIITDFEINSAKASQETALGLKEMLTEALINTNRFIINEPTSAETVNTEAGLIVTVSVTEFEPQISGGRAGIGGGGGAGSGVLGSLLGDSSNKASMALDISIRDALTSTILAAKQVQAQASDVVKSAEANSLKSLELGSGLYEYTDTPMEKVIRSSIFEAARYICQAVPVDYFKDK